MLYTLKERLKIYWQQHNPSTKCQEINNINIKNVFTPKGKQFHHKSNYLLLTEFVVCNVSYGTKFFSLMPHVKHTGHKSTGEKNEDQWLTVRAEKMRLVRRLIYYISEVNQVSRKGKETSMADHTVEYSPQNWPITVCFLTKRHNNNNYFFYFSFHLVCPKECFLA